MLIRKGKAVFALRVIRWCKMLFEGTRTVYQLLLLAAGRALGTPGSAGLQACGLPGSTAACPSTWLLYQLVTRVK